MEVIVDRIEENCLVLELENKEHINVPKSLIPNASEGDIIDIEINYAKRAKREEEVKKLSENLFIAYDEEE